MEQKRLLFNSSKTFLNEADSNDLFMELDILLLKNSANYNGYHFQEDFIDEIVANHDKYNGLPIVVDTEKLMSKDFFNLGHNYSPILDKFYSEQIGSYVSFSKQLDEKGIAELHGKARISKRNLDLIQVLMELYSSPIGLNFSVEVFASDYSIENNNLIIGASPDNLLMSDCLVSFPAEPDSKALKLVAQLNESLKGSKQMKDNRKDILSELSHSDIRSQLNNLLNPNYDVDGYRAYDYWISSVYSDYVIVSDEKQAGVYFKYTYTIDNDLITLGDKTQVSVQFVSLNSEGGTGKMKTAEELQTELDKANATIVSLGQERDGLAENNKALAQFQKEVTEKQSKDAIDVIINEIKENLTEDELKVLNELAGELNVDKVKFKVNEICASKYKETVKLTNGKNSFDFFAVAPQKDLSGDDLSKFNM